MALLHSTLLKICLQWLYFSLLDSTLPYRGFYTLYKTQHYSNMALLHSTFFTFIYHGSTSLYLTLHCSIMARLQFTLLYFTLPWLYFTLLDSSLPYLGSTSLNITLHCSTKDLLHSAYFIHSCTMTLLHSTLL